MMVTYPARHGKKNPPPSQKCKASVISDKVFRKPLHFSDNCVKLNENHEEVSNHA
jgi:hypothetical protein